MITEYFTQVCPFDDEYRVLFLFFVEKNEFFLMLGRELKGDSENSKEEDNSSSLVSLSSENKTIDEDEDDDSAYFVKITLDT